MALVGKKYSNITIFNLPQSFIGFRVTLSLINICLHCRFSNNRVIRISKTLMCQKHSEQLSAAQTTTYHDRDLVVILFCQVYQVEVIVDQIFQAAMEVPA